MCGKGDKGSIKFTWLTSILSAGLNHFNFKSVFGLDIIGVEWVDEKRIVKIGNLPIILDTSM